MSDIFFDFSAANNGTGTVPTQAASPGGVGAFNTVAGRTPLSGDTWWIRRTSSSDILAANITVNVVDFSIVGWPVVEDNMYIDRPTSGVIAGWDDDVEEYAVFNAGTNRSLVVDENCVRGNLFSGIYLLGTGSSGVVRLNMDDKSRHVVVERCRFENPLRNGNAPVALIDGDNHYISKLDLRGSALTTSTVYTVRWNASNCICSDLNLVFGRIDYTNDGFGLLISGAYNIFNRIDITLENSSLAGDLISISSGAANTKILNCMVTNTSGDTNAGIIVLSSDSSEIELDFNNQGPQSINVPSSFKSGIIKISNASFNSSFLLSGTDNYVELDNVVIPAGLTSVTNGNLIVAKDLLCDASYTSHIANHNSILYSMNHGQVAGLWRSESAFGYLQSSNVVRTGGGSFSLYGERTNLSAVGNAFYNFPYIGDSRAEAILLSLTTGARTVTVFGAHKLFSSPLKNTNLWLELEYKDGDGNPRIITSLKQSVLTTDNSVWVNDSGLTLFKMELGFTLPSNQVCPLRIRGNLPPESGAYFYLDVTPVIV